MNMKKITIITVSLLLAGASAFAWSKKSDSLGNLGRTYVSISGAVNVSKYKSSGVTDSPTGAQGSAVINAPILKPGINAFRDIKWAGLDGSIFLQLHLYRRYQSWQRRLREASPTTTSARS